MIVLIPIQPSSSFFNFKHNDPGFIDWLAPCFDIHSNVVNIVGILFFPFKFDLNIFHLNWDNAVYDKDKIPCVRIPLAFKNLNVVALVYHSGKVVLTGINHIDLAQKAFDIILLFYYRFHLKNDHFFRPLTLPFQITNVVATADFKQHIDLTQLPLLFPSIKFNSELFPAAILLTKYFTNKNTTVLIYANGKIVIAGAKKIWIAHFIAQFTAFYILKHLQIDRFNNFFLTTWNNFKLIIL